MQRVEIRFGRRELARRLCDMRSWLDRRGFEPAKFQCQSGDDAVKALLDFRRPTEASAFAAQFLGTVTETVV